MLNLSICLSDIPANKRVQAKNGKWYANITAVQMRETDQFGQTHTVYMSQTKEERENKTPKDYIGKGKEIIFENKQAPPAPPTPENVPEPEDDLPF